MASWPSKDKHKIYFNTLDQNNFPNLLHSSNRAASATPCFKPFQPPLFQKLIRLEQCLQSIAENLLSPTHGHEFYLSYCMPHLALRLVEVLAASFVSVKRVDLAFDIALRALLKLT
jgi:hypothetical protein